MKKLLCALILSVVGSAAAQTVSVDLLGAADTVVVVPARPTAADSLVFRVHDADHDCCTRYYQKNVSVSDSNITLSASYQDQKCDKADCESAGADVVFSCGPISPGTYRIYKTEDLYCPPGQICPAVAVKGEKEYLGEITVRDFPRFGKSLGQGAAASKSVLTYSSAEKKLTLRLAKAQTVVVTAFIVNGEKSSELSSTRFLPAGTHIFRLDRSRFPRGVVVIHVKGDDFSEVQMVNLTK